MTWSNVQPIRAGIHKRMRTPGEVRADLEARYAEMEREAEWRRADPEINFPCEKCRFYSTRGDDGFRWTAPAFRKEYATCTQPLIKGFREWGVRIKGGHNVKLCGPEKALWQPKLTPWQRAIEWFIGPWKKDA